MDVQRARFLALTASIAAMTACRTVPASRAPSSGAGGNTPRGTAETMAPGPTSADESIPPDGATDPQTDDRSACDDVNAMGQPGGPARCDALQPAPGVCDPSGEGFQDLRDTCVRLESALAPRIAERAVSCLVARSGTPRICSDAAVTDCAIDAFESSCGDSASLDTCRRLVEACDTSAAPTRDGRRRFTLGDCEEAFASVHREAREEMTSCMLEGCGVGDLVECFLYVGATAR
ncbi:MAG TPA: hypothetical protein VGL81_06600 [Polyangiaceae bacterium]|jgi:hypothetical protein